MTVWYITVRKDSTLIINGYPVLVYAEKERAKTIADDNGHDMIPVVPAYATIEQKFDE